MAICYGCGTRLLNKDTQYTWCDKCKSTLGFREWFNRNMIYCETTHSFVHRLFNKRLGWESYRDAQQDAKVILREIEEEYEKQMD